MNALTFSLCALVTFAPSEEDAGPASATVVVSPVTSQTELPEARAELVMRTVQSELPAELVEVVPAGEEGEYAFSISVDEPSPQDFTVRVKLASADGETVIAEYEETCTICSDADLERLVRERTLDAQLALQRELAPEEFGGEAPEPETVVVEGPVQTRVEVQFAERSRLVPTGWALVGAGAVATAGGALLLGLSGGDAGCHDDPRGGNCVPLVYDTVIPGAVVGGAGLTLVATGVGLVVAGRKKDKRERARVQELALGAIPGGVSLRGEF